MNVISFLYELLFDPKRKKKKKNNPELFHSDDFLRPNHPNFRICPKCSIESNTNKEAAKIFGLRNINNHTTIQSWCIKCRNNKDYKKNDERNQEEIKV